MTDSGSSNLLTSGSLRQRGFTLVELMMAVGITAILGSLAVSSYRFYILRGEAAQTLADYGHIRTVIGVETHADGQQDLHLDSQPGAVPPRLAGMLDAREFNGPDGQQFQLVRAPAGTFASYPDREVYALVDSADSFNGRLRLRVLHKSLPHGPGDKVWLSASQLIFPIDPGGDTSASTGTPSPPGPTSPGPTSPVPTPPAPVPPDTTPPGGTTPGIPSPPPVTGGGSTVTGQGSSNGNTWSADIEICVGAASGGRLTGYDNINVIYRVITKYATFTENYAISSATGCVTRSYPGQPGDGSVRIEVISVLNYTVSGTSATPLWDGVMPSLVLTGPP